MAWRLIHKQTEDASIAGAGTHWAEQIALNPGGNAFTTWLPTPGRGSIKGPVVMPDVVVVHSRLTGVSGSGAVSLNFYMAYGPSQEHLWRVRSWSGSDAYAPDAQEATGPSDSQLYSVNVFAFANVEASIAMPLVGDEYRMRVAAGGTVDGDFSYWTEWYADIRR